MQHTPAQPADCPDGAQIRAFALGDLPVASLSVVGTHIDGCSQCQSVLESYDDMTDTFVDQLRAQASETLDEDDPQLKELIAVAVQLRGETNTLQTETSQPFSLEQYELLDELGRGGMGVVYRAWHKKLQRHVAIKLISPHRSPRPQATVRFHREMAAIGRLHHPNIVHAYDAGEMDGRPYLVMELIDGNDTRRLVERYGPLPVAAACEIIRQAAEGLHYAHGAGLLHRDVKPSNLMLTEEGRVKILDLGLARFDAPESAADGANDHDIAGTGTFVAPEQILVAQYAQPYDARADLYSLGGTFYFLLTGRPPIDMAGAYTLSAKAALHAEVPHTPVAELRSEVPSDVAAVLDRCLQKQPGDRFQSAADVANALEPLCRGVTLARISHFPNRKRLPLLA